MSAIAGRVLLIPKGAYNALTTYNPLDFVTYGANSYVCKQTSTGNAPTNTTYWQLMAQGATNANNISYDGTASGLGSTDVQGAIDEVVSDTNDALSAITNVYNAKNLWFTDNISTTMNGVTFTVNKDGTISTSGTTNASPTYFDIIASQATVRDLLNDLDDSLTYKLNGVPEGADASVNIVIWNNAKVVRSYAGQDVTFSKPATIASFNTLYRIDITGTGVNMNGLVFKPQVRDSRIPDATYEPFAKTNAQLTKDVSGITNPNLFLNPFFTVNTGGQTSYTDSATCVDRWQRSGETTGAPTLTVGTVQLPQLKGNFYQRIDQSRIRLVRKPYTISVIIDGVLYSKTFTPYADGTSHAILTSAVGIDGILWNVREYWSGTNHLFGISCANATSAHTITAMKLEEGEVSTLMNDAPPNYAIELAKCQASTDYASDTRANQGNIVLQKSLTDIIINGTTNNTGSTIDIGKYFYLNGEYCVALASIANGATFTLNTNYKKTNVGSELTPTAVAITNLTNGYLSCKKIGKGIFVRGDFSGAGLISTLNAWATLQIATLPSDIVLDGTTWIPVTPLDNGSNSVRVEVTTGAIQIRNWSQTDLTNVGFSFSGFAF